jgi:hypothetical protein
VKSGSRLALWAVVSLALHGLLLLWLAGSRFEPPEPAAPPMWMEAVVPKPEPAPIEEPPPPPPRPVRKIAPAPPRPSLARPTPAPAPAPALRAPVVDGPSSVSVAEGESGLGTSGTSRAERGEAGGTGDADGAPGEAQRALGPAQLALALEPAQLERMALVRPTIALLMAMPGYADILRGSGIQPLSDLSRARVRVLGLSPERLSLAGVHVAGEAAVVTAAERVAAMREQAPEWRGDSDLRATSWVDGSGFDRGLAVQGGAFVIAARSALPGLLATEDAVRSASKLRERAFVDIWMEDAPRYLPGVEACALQALRVSLTDAASGQRMLLSAQYKTGSAARAGAACWRALDANADARHGQWKTIASWLARAESSEGFGVQLNLGVTSDDIQRLFDELAWALRSAKRA